MERRGGDEGDPPQFYVASRGHHADIGGITPGSMPPRAPPWMKKGVLIDNFLLVDQGQFREAELRQLLADAPYPARNVTKTSPTSRLKLPPM
jgi:5-oxoprolinase (ATP-hydrolysing)